jgi:tetratricopeptide (TPR) repeat protein
LDKINWTDLLGWGTDELSDLRFVGYAYVKQGKYDIALKFFEALIILDPDNEYDLQTLGALYLQIGDNVSALNCLEKALRVNPIHAPTLLNRAKALFLLGYKRQATIQAKDLENHPDSLIADSAKALLLSYS